MVRNVDITQLQQPAGWGKRLDCSSTQQQQEQAKQLGPEAQQGLNMLVSVAAGEDAWPELWVGN